MSIDTDGNPNGAIYALELHPDSLAFRNRNATGETRAFGYHEVDLVLLSPASVLSFQIGNDVFRVAIKRDSAKVKQILETLLYKIRSA